MSVDLSGLIGANLPYLRRYARALSGNQRAGDHFAAATLEAIVTDAVPFDPNHGAKIALFQAFHHVWDATDKSPQDADDTLAARAQAHMTTLTPLSREALLLHTIESFPAEDVAKILGIDTNQATNLIDIAMSEMSKSIRGKVLVIEDEPIIAIDIRAIVTEMGHTVTNIARTRADAVTAAAAERPDLVLADIQLADNSSGVDAVNDILRDGDIPVVFITAFPERLLTGERPEPAFLITKPYSDEQVQSAVSQAMFFASTETLMRQI